MIRTDAVQHHFDANENVFFQRQLESVEATIYKVKKRELKYRMYIPVSNRDNPGAMSITYRMYDLVGMAKIIADYADDLPRADVFGKEYTQPVKTIGSSFGYNTQELRSAIMAGVSLETDKASAMRRTIREKESKVAWVGDSATGLLGFLTNANIPSVAAPNGATTPLWSAKTSDEIYLDITNMATKIRVQSKGIHEGDTLLLPIPQYNIIASKKMSADSDLTIMEFVMKPGNSLGIKKIDWLSTELTLAFTSGTEDGAVLYENSSEVMEQRIPMELQLRPVQERNLEFIVPGESRHGGVVIRYPLAMTILTGI